MVWYISSVESDRAALPQDQRVILKRPVRRFLGVESIDSIGGDKMPRHDTSQYIAWLIGKQWESYMEMVCTVIY